MQRNRLFAAGLAAALMLGAASSPALAKPGKAKGHAYGKSKTKPEKEKPAPAKKAKKTKAGVSGGGTVANGSFSIQARLRSTDKGHFNYTSTNGAFKVRCRGFNAYDTAAVSATYPRTVSVTFKSCAITGQAARGPLTVTVTDNGKAEPKDGQPAVAPVAPDAVGFSMPGPVATDGSATTTPYGGNLVDGNVKIR